MSYAGEEPVNGRLAVAVVAWLLGWLVGWFALSWLLLGSNAKRQPTVKRQLFGLRRAAIEISSQFCERRILKENPVERAYMYHTGGRQGMRRTASATVKDGFDLSALVPISLFAVD